MNFFSTFRNMNSLFTFINRLFVKFFSMKEIANSLFFSAKRQYFFAKNA